MHNKNISPVDWYLCSYLLRFIELDDPEKDNPDAKFLSWENTVIIKATSITEAFEKTVQLASNETEPYKGGPQGINVQWVFEGVTSVLPIYEELGDGAEIAWCERHPRKLKNLRGLVVDKESLYQ